MTYVLVAEDEVDIQLLICRKLELSGYSDVWATTDGQAALDKALSDPPRVMILDIMLPTLDGLQVCSEIKQQLGENAPRIIIISARGQRDQIEAGNTAGADMYVVKPFSPRELVEKVTQLWRS